MYNPYLLLFEISHNGLFIKKEDIAHYLEVSSIKLEYAKHTIVKRAIHENSSSLIDFKIPILTCKWYHKIEFSGTVPLLFKTIKYEINESKFKLEALRYPFFGKNDTEKIAKANETLKKLYSTYNLKQGIGHYPLIDWEASIKFWKPYIYDKKKYDIENGIDTLSIYDVGKNKSIWKQ